MKPRHSSTALPELESARAAGLRYATDRQPGIRRVKSGAGFRYQDANGRAVRAEEQLKRIRSLAIPPAWTEVWISADADAHLQATGRDARGRKQHRYHPLWRQVRDATKYERMVEFGEALPKIRQRIGRDLARPGLSREKVLATIVRLMDLTFIRVGNDEYARQNGSFGLTTLKDQHAKVRGARVQFSFRGKSGKHHVIEVEDPRLARVVKKAQDIPGQELFQYLDEDGAPHDITSGDVNDYLREISGSDFTAKDFRTWAGTVLTARALQRAGRAETQRQAKRLLQQAIEAVAETLGNTPTVCRKCYVHPALVEGYMNGELAGRARTDSQHRKIIDASRRRKTSLDDDERAVLEFLRCCRKKKTQLQRESIRAGLPKSWQRR
jgi:DNA topoisomerase I